jgi:cell division septal protein FtsQ
MSVQAPSDKRFRRAHVAPTRRRRLWPPDWKVVAGCLAGLVLVSYAGYRGLSWAMGDDALVIQRITVEGNVRMSTGEVTSLLDGLRGQNMLTADLEPWKETLKASPWISDVAFRRVFPGRVAVAVIERTPIGIGRLGDTLFLVDRHGSLIELLGARPPDPERSGRWRANRGAARGRHPGRAGGEGRRRRVDTPGSGRPCFGD